jgi:hypothetical protein
MSNVVTSITRKLKRKDETALEGRHRRDGFFDEQDVWHDAQLESAVLADASVAR